jgi:hypothetical protein
MQEEVARKVASGDAKEIYDAMVKVYRDRAAATRCSLPLRGEDYRLLHSDFRKIGHGVPSDSVDLILTDAPYESKYLDLFEPLSLFASRVQRQGGSLADAVRGLGPGQQRCMHDEESAHCRRFQDHAHDPG